MRSARRRARRPAIAIVGVDIGTQSLKALVTSDDLRPLGAAATPYAPDTPRPGWAEQAPELWDGALGADGRALGPCLIWMDRRAEAEAEAVDAGDLRRRAGVNRDATHMAAKIRWLKRTLGPDQKTMRFHQPVSYLVARLTGEHVFDHGPASTTMLYSLERRDLDPELLAAFGIAADELPSIAGASDRAGALSAAGAELAGLPAGIPVAVGMGDDHDCDTADCGARALELAHGDEYDIILFDIGLPDIDGYEVLNPLRAVGVTAPVIFQSGLVLRKNEVKDLGIEDCLAKPFGRRELRESLQSVIPGRSAHR